MNGCQWVTTQCPTTNPNSPHVRPTPMANPSGQRRGPQKWPNPTATPTANPMANPRGQIYVYGVGTERHTLYGITARKGGTIG